MFTHKGNVNAGTKVPEKEEEAKVTKLGRFMPRRKQVCVAGRQRWDAGGRTIEDAHGRQIGSGKQGASDGATRCKQFTRAAQRDTDD